MLLMAQCESQCRLLQRFGFHACCDLSAHEEAQELLQTIDSLRLEYCAQLLCKELDLRRVLHTHDVATHKLLNLATGQCVRLGQGSPQGIRRHPVGRLLQKV
tara:strand:+ start:264 stop:569 length:306 start_codon:yes stop_codon:yes gene_type:complete